MFLLQEARLPTSQLLRTRQSKIHQQIKYLNLLKSQRNSIKEVKLKLLLKNKHINQSQRNLIIPLSQNKLCLQIPKTSHTVNSCNPNNGKIKIKVLERLTQI